MIDIVSLIIGLVGGAVVGGLGIYLLPYQTLRREQGATQVELAEIQSKNNGLQADLLDVQSTAYQSRQAALQQQKRLEEQLAEAGERQVKLEKRIADLETQREQEQQTYLREATRLRGAILRLEQEQVALQDRYAQDSARWERERQNLGLQTAHMEQQYQALHQDKSGLDQRLEQQQEAWERERLALQIQMNTLEDNLALQKARSGSNSSLGLDSALVVEQLRSEAAAELSRRQAAWDEERQKLQEQLERLHAERRALREQVAASTDLPSASSESELRQQLEQAQRDRRALEEKLATYTARAEQERSALEVEIEQLMERVLRLQGGSGR
jgi:hypothetical protein